MHQLPPDIHSQLNDTVSSVKYLIPEIYLAGLFLLVLIGGLVYKRNALVMCRFIAVLGLLLVLAQDVIQCYLPAGDVRPLFAGMLLLHQTPVFFKLIIDGLSILLAIYFPLDRQLRAHQKGLADLYAIHIGAVLGLHLMVMAVNLLSIYLSIEFVSLAAYLLVSYRSENGFSAGAGLKYVLFGAAASAIMLYGMSLLYAFTGTTDIYAPAFIQNLSKVSQPATTIALLLVMAGIGFKLAFVPMHFWAPDVYQGAATPVTALLSTLPKIAAFGLLIHVVSPFLLSGHWAGIDFRVFLSAIAIITMLTGNIAAVMQTNIKRLLAWSAIGHTGFALMAVVTLTSASISALLFYLTAYAIANIAALMLASYFNNATGAESISDLKGLGIKMPVSSISFVIVLISLTGLPVTAGFIGKLLIFQSAYQAYQQVPHLWLLLLPVTGALTTVISLFYYLKIPLYLFLRKANSDQHIIGTNKTLLIITTFAAILLIFLGLFPNYLSF